MDMTMMLHIIIPCAAAVLEFLTIGIPSIVKIRKTVKNLKNAESNEKRLEALNDLQEQAKVFIEAAEIAYKEINDTLKAKGSSAGPVKKDSVMLKLQSYATEKNYTFDVEYWSEKIDELVKYTKNVNK